MGCLKSRWFATFAVVRTASGTLSAAEIWRSKSETRLKRRAVSPSSRLHCALMVSHGVIHTHDSMMPAILHTRPWVVGAPVHCFVPSGSLCCYSARSHRACRSGSNAVGLCRARSM